MAPSAGGGDIDRACRGYQGGDGLPLTLPRRFVAGPSLPLKGGGFFLVAYAAALRSGATVRVASVADCTWSTVTPGASSFRVTRWDLRSIWKTPRSVTTMSTTPAPVSG